MPLAIFLLSFLIFPWAKLFATQPLSPPYTEVWSPAIDRLQPNRLGPPMDDQPRRDLDNYIGRLAMIAAFLDSMQEHDPESENFGGLHEGESQQLWAIVETDNTQEAIRVWCEYALFFEDYELYRQNVIDAWVYVENFPAWDEGPQLFYRIHNCGWGLVAESAYRAAYDDDWHEYGVRCAEFLALNTPRIDPDLEDRLMPLTAGWAAGTLYRYGLAEQNGGFLESALRIAGDIQDWIDADETRLRANEIWALCGGTAMWGVLSSLGLADPDATTEWAVQVLPEMDVFAGNGLWNNSWNIWYAHAWLAAYELTGEADHQTNAIAIVDSLLAQDGDGDGGIPATIGDDDDRDQSWVTAYIAWMGLVNLFDALPDVNAAVTALLSPTLQRPHPVGTPIQFAFSLENRGRLDRIELPLRLTGGWEFDTTFALQGWLPMAARISTHWIPDNPGEVSFTAFAAHDDDPFPDDDTLRFQLNILPTGLVRLSAVSYDGTPLVCRFDFFNLDIAPEAVFASMTTDPIDGEASGDLMTGFYRIEATPDFPYPLQTIDEFQIIADHPNDTQVTFDHPAILLVDRDTDSTHAWFYETALQASNYVFRRWNGTELGTFSDRSVRFNTVILFTGDRDEDLIPVEDRAEIRRHLGSGGNLFITGQNIPDELAGDGFLEEVLRARRMSDDMRGWQVVGVDGDEVLDGASMLLLGQRGANNQDSPAGIEGGSTAASNAQSTADTPIPQPQCAGRRLPAGAAYFSGSDLRASAGRRGTAEKIFCNGCWIGWARR